jgi:molybdate transport system regulatory protein
MKQTKPHRKAGKSDPRLRACARAWINLDGRPFLGPGRVRLLRAVDEVGSISGAARRLGLSYRAAWNHIDAMNNRAGAPLVATSAGGEGGGGARLTELGRRAVAGYSELVDALERFREEVQGNVLLSFADFPLAPASPGKGEDEPEG